MAFVLALLVLVITPAELLARNGLDEIVYGGKDDRTDVAYHRNGLWRNYAKSVAAQIPSSRIKFLYGGLLAKISGTSLEESHHKVCSDQNYSYQSNLATCSGFLIAEDLLMTAGHCAKGRSIDCTNSSWVFDYRTEIVNNRFWFVGSKDTASRVMYMDGNNIYNCSEIIEYRYGRYDLIDYAIIKLDRSVFDRQPLKLRIEGKVEDGEVLMTLGYPSGLPMKVTDNGKILNNDNNGFFVTDLDAFSGNSGSPVINGQTGIVEGILVRGGQDYVAGKQAGCKDVNYCQGDDCIGEVVTRVTSIPLEKVELN